MIIGLTGDNSYGLKQRLGELTSAFIKKHGELALERLDADEIESAAILETIQSLPFLASRKMVILRDLSANTTAAERVEQIIDAAGDEIDLIIVEPLPDKRTSYYKVIQKRTQLEIFEELDPRGLAGWLVQEAKKLGGQINQADASYLVERVGANQQLLASELIKLVTYEPQVSRQTIDLLTEPNPQTKVFDLLDAAFAGNKTKTLKLYAEQRAQKIEPQVILAMIAWQLRVLTVIKLGAGKSPAKDFGLNPYVASKSSCLAAEISIQKLKNLVGEALDIDYSSKTSSLDLDEALKTYLITI